MVTLASDWRRKFRLLCNRRAEFDETWQGASACLSYAMLEGFFRANRKQRWLRWSQLGCHFLARLHFSAEELLLYPRRQRPRRRPACKMLGQMLVLEFKSFCIFSCILSLLIILIKPLTTKSLRQARIRWLWHLWFPSTLQPLNEIWRNFIVRKIVHQVCVFQADLSNKKVG